MAHTFCRARADGGAVRLLTATYERNDNFV